jgi:hypothetical protein
MSVVVQKISDLNLYILKKLSILVGNDEKHPEPECCTEWILTETSSTPKEVMVRNWTRIGHIEMERNQ